MPDILLHGNLQLMGAKQSTMSGDFGARQSGGARGWLNSVRSPPWRLMIVLEQRANEQRSDNTYSMLYKGFRMPPLPLPTSDFSPCPKRPCGVQHTRVSFGQASSLYPMSSSSNPHFPQVPKARAVFECLSGCQAMGLGLVVWDAHRVYQGLRSGSFPNC